MSLLRIDSQVAPVDQSPHDHRPDMLVYETRPLEADLVLIGAVALRLWAATDGPNTDWSAKLAVVHRDGVAVNLTYGIARARFRNGFDQPAPVIPGEVIEYTVPLNPVGVRLKPGERLRLYLSSSDFPNLIGTTTPETITGVTPSSAPPTRRSTTARHDLRTSSCPWFPHEHRAEQDP